MIMLKAMVKDAIFMLVLGGVTYVLLMEKEMLVNEAKQSRAEADKNREGDALTL